MAGTDGSTQNYGWTLPAVHGSQSSWGDKLNANFQGIDSQVKTNDNAIAAINGRFTSNILNLTKTTVAAGAYIASYLNSTLRWVVWLGGATAEGGNDTGSDLTITRYHDDGTYIDTPLQILRQTGQVVLSQAPTTAQSAATKAYVDAGANVVGAVTMFAGVTPPAGWTWCSGAALSRTTYAALFAVIGTRFGAGDGSTTFNLPNLFGRMPVGYDGGGWAMGNLGGVYTLTQNELPTHTHVASDGGHQHYVNLTQSPHAHIDSGHLHGASQPAHTHTVGGVTGSAGAGAAAGSGATLVTGTTSAAQPAITVAAGQAVIQPINANVAVTARNGNGAANWSDVAAASISIGNAGNGAAYGNMPPYQVIGFIIRCV